MSDSKKNRAKSNSWIFLLLICITTCFMGIAFAQINKELDISGSVAAESQEGIFITEVNYLSNVNADINVSKILNTYQTILNSSIVLSETDGNSNITYEIEIYNSNDVDYKFTGTTYMIGNDTYDNENIVFSLDGIAEGDVVKSKEECNFRITFHYKNNVFLGNNQLNSFINFVFEENAGDPFEGISAGTLNTNSTSGIFGGTIQKGSVESIYFVNHENVPENASNVWDASVEGNYKITGWSVDDNQNGLLEVYFGANDGRITLPSNCNSLFYWYTSLTKIEFNNIDTSQVTDMGYMFAYSYALTDLDLSNFDTSNVIKMSYMFASVSKVETFDLSNFDTTNVTSMGYMFSGTNPKLIKFNNATFSHLSSLYGVIPNISTPLTIVVKDAVERDYVKSKSYMGVNTQILTVEEYESQN